MDLSSPELGGGMNKAQYKLFIVELTVSVENDVRYFLI
jgi:hypothetical protein